MASQQSEMDTSSQPKEEKEMKFIQSTALPQKANKYTDRKNSSTSEESLQFAWLLKQRTGAAYVFT